MLVFTFSTIVVIETKNRTLEETAALFDGEEVAEQIAAAAAARDLASSEKDEKLSGSFHEHQTKA